MKHSATMVAKTTCFEWATVAKHPPTEEGHMGMCHTWKPLWHYQSLPGREGVRKKQTSEGIVRAGRDGGSGPLSCLGL